jgi:hypothetical protein
MDGPISVCTGDFDEDGHTDIAMANNGYDYFTYDVSILLGTGDGTFTPAVNYTPGSSPRSVCTGDFDEDNHIDLAVANGGSDNVSILLGSGDGSFATAVNFGTGDSPFCVCAADFDEDGHIDLATANYNSDNVSILLGGGDGTFAAPVSYGTGDRSYSVCSSDFDGDGHIDLAVANSNDDNISVLLGVGDGTFETTINYNAGDGAISVCADDFDEDNSIDLAVANINSDDVSIFINLTEHEVSVMLETYMCFCRENGIEISWKLSEEVRSIDFLIYRERGGGGAFLPLEIEVVRIDDVSYRLVDNTCEPGESYRYRVDVSDDEGRRTLFATESTTTEIPVLTLSHNYPNPFNPVTIINFRIPGEQHVTLDIFDTSGRLVIRLVDSVHDAGSHETEWTGFNESGKAVSSGVYFYRLTAGKERITKKMLLMR